MYVDLIKSVFWFIAHFSFLDFTGCAEESGVGNGLGFNINYPLPRGTVDANYCSTLSLAVAKIVHFDPSYVIVR